MTLGSPAYGSAIRDLVEQKDEWPAEFFKPKNIPGGVIWNIQEQETSHAA